MIYLHENGVTIVAKNEAKRGKVYELNGEKYYIARGVADIQRIVDSGEFPLNRVITSKLTSLNCLFQIKGGYNQAAVPDNFNDDISNWDTSNVLSMEEVFSGWPKFNQDISNWDTSKVESMYGMFKSSKYKGSYHMGPTSFNQDISNWDVSNVKNMSEMFLGATSFNQDISNWDVSNVENMSHMFSGATSFNQDIGNWDVSNVKNMSYMFSDIDSIGILAFVGTLEYTRAGSTSFNQDISNWDVSNVENMEYMFSGATSFNQDIGNWDVSNVPCMDHMFSSATSFNQPIGNWNTSKVISMNGMFSYAKSFNQDIGNWDVKNVNNMNDMFSGATSFNQDISNWDVGSLVGVQNMFYGATSFNAPIGKWKLNCIINMENMFREATTFNQDISSWDVSNVTQMKGLFQDATSFNQNIRKWKLNEKLPKSPTIFKDAKAFNIKEYNPFLNKKAKKRKNDTSTANLSPEDKKTISKIKKLLIERDFEKIDLGLELLISLNNLELFETLLHDCKIGPNYYSLITNKFFTGSSPAQPYLDYALINIIANAPQEAKMDDSLLLKNIFSPDTDKISFNDISNSELRDFLVRSIDKFSSLTSVDVTLDSSKGHNYEELFANNNITDLTVSGNVSNLKWLNNFGQLKVLIFKVYAENIDDYENFKYLENLEELTFNSSRFDNLDFLAKCKKLKKLDLSISYNPYSYSNTNDVKLENIDFLSKLQQLEELVISGLSSSYVEIGLEALKNCSQIKILTLDIEEEGANQLKFLNKCKSLEVLNLTSYKDFNLFGKISSIQMLSGLKSLKSISVGNLGQYATVEELSEGNRPGALPFNFYGINDSLMTDLEFKYSKSPISKGNKLRVSENQISKIDGYFYHEGLAYSGEVFKELDGHILYEYSVKEGCPSGIYREFYYGSDKIKMEQLFDGYNLSNHQLLSFFDKSGRNLFENKQIVHSAKLSLSENKLLKDGELYNGYTLIELTHNRSRLGFSWKDVTGFGAIKVHFYMPFSNIIDVSEITFNYGFFKNPDHQYYYLKDKVSFILKIENGSICEQINIISNDNLFIGKMSNFSDSNINEINFISENNKAIGVLKDKSVVISGVFENYSRNELKEIIEMNNGKNSSSITKNTSFLLAGEKMGPKKKILANDLGVDIINEKEFIDKYINSSSTNTESLSIYSFFYNENNVDTSLEKSKLSAEDKKVLSEVKKNLLSRDYNLIDDGVKKLSSLNNHLLFENLLDGCSISETKPNYFELNTNKNFTGSGPAQPYLNYALFQVLANLPKDTNVVNSLRINQNTSLDTKAFNLSELYSQFISLDKFSFLESLKIDFKIFEIMNKGANPEITRENWFKNSNLKKLDISNFSGSFKFLKNLKDLEYLSLEFGFYKYDYIEYFKFLENIKTLNLTKINYSSYNKVLKDLDFLKNLKKIKSLNITLNQGYGSSENVETLDVIKNFNALESLVLRGIPSEINLDFLLDCKGLKFLILDFSNNNETINLECLKNCSVLEKLILNNIGEINIEGKISDINKLNELENLRTLKIKDIIISGINGKVFID